MYHHRLSLPRVYSKLFRNISCDMIKLLNSPHNGDRFFLKNFVSLEWFQLNQPMRRATQLSNQPK